MEKIKVIMRMRPFSESEKHQKCEKAWNLDIERDQISSLEKSQYNASYTFDAILPSTISNKVVYKQNCQDLIMRSLEGIDTTIFVYG